MMKKIILLLTLVATLLLSTATTWAASQSMVDKARILTPAQRMQVETQLKAVEQKLSLIHI